jgi:phage-related baseplate assembly protein
MSELNFIETDTDKLKNDILEKMKDGTGELLYPGDERRIFAEAFAYAWATAVSAVNEQCKGRLLKHARGHQLDALGERVMCTRLKPQPARIELKFTLATSRPNDITIPAGTTVTADNNVLFTTNEAVRVPAGELEVSGVQATATIGGTVTNGVPVGAVQSFVDKVPYVTGVINTTASSGGDDGEPYPLEIDPEHGDNGAGDENYRERIKLAPAGFSSAGSELSYEYFARSASANVEGVKVLSNQQAGRTDIYITEKGGVAPSEGTLDAVLEAVTDKKVKALNDYVTVQAPEAVSYDIELTYYVEQANESAAVKAIEGVGGLIEQYNAWQQAAIGRNIDPQELIVKLRSACHWVDVVQPQRTTIEDNQIARFSGNLNVTHIIQAG